MPHYLLRWDYGGWNRLLLANSPLAYPQRHVHFVNLTMAKQTFEESLEKLEQITREMENGALSLEASLKKFDEGMRLADFCASKLDEAQKRVDILIKKDGVLSAEPFDEHVSGS